MHWVRNHQRRSRLAVVRVGLVVGASAEMDPLRARGESGNVDEGADMGGGEGLSAAGPRQIPVSGAYAISDGSPGAVTRLPRRLGR